jgi:hypothetical protein
MEQIGCNWKDFHEIPHMNIFLKSVKKIQVLLTRIMGALHEDRSTFLIISRSDILIMRNVSGKSCRENQNPRFMSNSV